MIKLSREYLCDFISASELANKKAISKLALDQLLNKNGAGSDFLGWLDLANTTPKALLDDINACATKIQQESDVLVVIGIGGSYLGARSVIEMMHGLMYNEFLDTKVIFVGQNMSSQYLNDVLKYLENKDFSINVISKSGTTTEPAIAFRILKDVLINKYGNQAHERIYVTTDANKGALKVQADKNNWKSFVIADDIGGRFSVLSPVGLLPIAAANININELIAGAIKADELKSESSIALEYASIRNCLYEKGFTTEILASYEPKMTQFNEWFKQLFGESEGKDRKGIFPASVIYSTDLHSLGQYIQDGRRNLFETVIRFNTIDKSITVDEATDNSDDLNYLSGKYLDEINNTALKATVMAHVDGGVPNIVIDIDEFNEQVVGYLIYFFELSCAISGYMLGVNPFNQEGVEAYKKNMFSLLNKPGYENIK